MPQPEHTSFLQLYAGSLADPMLLVLIVCALASLGIEMALRPTTGWIDGTAILLAVQIVALVTSANNYRNELQFRRLNAVSNAIIVKVVRDGAAVQVRRTAPGVRCGGGSPLPAAPPPPTRPCPLRFPSTTCCAATWCAWRTGTRSRPTAC